jgi:hypothetical protein
MHKARLPPLLLLLLLLLLRSSVLASTKFNSNYSKAS